MKPRTQSNPATAPSEVSDPRTGGSFSIRLTKEERDLLDTAAKLRGWTTAKLIKTAALERAAQIRNVGSPNRVDFARIAGTMADHLLLPKRAEVPDGPGWEWEEAKIVSESLSEAEMVLLTRERESSLVRLTPGELHPSFVSDLLEAVRYGGTEFAAMLGVACQAVAQRRNPDSLPEPIDPARLTSQDEVSE